MREQSELRGELSQILTEASIARMEELFDQSSPYQRQVMLKALNSYSNVDTGYEYLMLKAMGIEAAGGWNRAKAKLAIGDPFLKSDILGLLVLHEFRHIFDTTPAAAWAPLGVLKREIWNHFRMPTLEKLEHRAGEETRAVIHAILEDPVKRAIFYEKMAIDIGLNPNQARALADAEWTGDAFVYVSRVMARDDLAKRATAAFDDLSDSELADFAQKVVTYAMSNHILFPAFNRNREAMQALITHLYTPMIRLDVRERRIAIAAFASVVGFGIITAAIGISAAISKGSSP